MKRIKTIWLSVLAVLLTVACSDDVEQATGSSAPMPIRLTIANTSQTRGAADTHLLENIFPDGTNIQIKINGKVYIYQYSSQKDELICLSDTLPYYPLDGSSVSVLAFHPVDKNNALRWNACWWNLGTDQYTNENYIESDQMFGKPLAGWQGLDSSGKVKPTTDKIPLQFDHVMAKIMVNVSVTDTKTSKIKRVYLNNIKLCTHYDFINGKIDSTSNQHGRNYVDIYYDNTGTRSNITCCGLIPPQTCGTDNNFIVAELSDGGKLYYKLSAPTRFESGQVYTYNIGTAVTGTRDMIILSDTLFTYNGSSKSPTITVKRGSTTLTKGTDYDFDTSTQNSGTNAGTYTVKVNFKGRYCGQAQRTWVIKPVAPNITVPSSFTSLKYNGSAQTLLSSGGTTDHGTMEYMLGTATEANGSWSTSLPKATEIGKYYVWYRVKGSGNYATTVAMGPKTVYLRKKPGQVICSNGDIVEYSKLGNRTPVAVVVKWGDDTGSSKFTRGVALALKDAGNGSTYKWSTESVLRNPVQYTTSYPIESGDSYVSSPYNTNTYPAFKAAISNNGTAAPSGTSGWFLPSIYQWDWILYSMGEATDARYNNLRNYFYTRGGTNLNSGKYILCTEKDKSTNVYVDIGNQKWSTQSKSATGYVRAMLLF